MLSTLALVIATAAPLKLAALGFSHANVDASVAAVASDHFAQQLSGRGLKVVTEKELAALIGLERQRQLLGCADSDSSCLAELSNALGVDAVVTGSLGRFGSRYTVNLKVTRATDGASLAVFSTEVESEDALPSVLSKAAGEVAEQLRPPAPGLPTSHRVGMGIGYGISAALIAGSVAGFVLAAGARDSLSNATTATLNTTQAFARRSEGQTLQTTGFVLLGIGAAATLVTGIIVFAIGERVSMSAGPNGVAAWGTF